MSHVYLYSTCARSPVNQHLGMAVVDQGLSSEVSRAFAKFCDPVTLHPHAGLMARDP